MDGGKGGGSGREGGREGEGVRGREEGGRDGWMEGGMEGGRGGWAHAHTTHTHACATCEIPQAFFWQMTLSRVLLIVIEALMFSQAFGAARPPSASSSGCEAQESDDDMDAGDGVIDGGVQGPRLQPVTYPVSEDLRCPRLAHCDMCLYLRRYGTLTWCNRGEAPRLHEFEVLGCCGRAGSTCHAQSEEVTTELEAVINTMVRAPNKSLRYEMYRRILRELHGRVGHGVRLAISCCLLNRIRVALPDATWTFTGFIAPYAWLRACMHRLSAGDGHPPMFASESLAAGDPPRDLDIEAAEDENELLVNNPGLDAMFNMREQERVQREEELQVMVDEFQEIEKAEAASAEMGEADESDESVSERGTDEGSDDSAEADADDRFARRLPASQLVDQYLADVDRDRFIEADEDAVLQQQTQILVHTLSEWSLELDCELR